MTKIVILLGFYLLVIGWLNYQSYNRSKSQDTNVYFESDLNNDGQKEVFLFYSPPVDLSDGTTRIYINGQKDPSLILRGYFMDNKIFDIKKGLRVLEVEVMTGKSVNSLIYRYQDGALKRIPVSTEKLPHYMGIVARNTPEFKDIDGDGIMEMFAYYRYFPPEKKRKVEVYKFNGVGFEKQKQYEESTPEIYL